MKKQNLYISLCLGFILSALALSYRGEILKDNVSPPPTLIKAQGTIEVAFSPKNGATQAIINAINQAHTLILVASYNFTSAELAAALLRAHKRGVKIMLLFDKSQISQKYSSSRFFANLGLEQRIDYKHALFHDKFMVIDDNTVITGSFNFTKSAELRNAENVLILRNNPQLAKLFSQDWWYNWHEALSRAEFLMKYRKNDAANFSTE
jgi:phosphatidylserine/phosphatidylglycerophosphate/cardiolipin synthase-like enzyme